MVCAAGGAFPDGDSATAAGGAVGAGCGGLFGQDGAGDRPGGLAVRAGAGCYTDFGGDGGGALDR